MQINGAALRAIRERTGESLTGLSQSSGIELTALSRLENGGRKGTPAQIKALAIALQVPITAITTSAIAEVA